MDLIKRVISMVICAIILFLSPVSVYFSAINISTVYASGPIALTAEAIYVLCQYLGSLGMAYAPVQRPDLPTDEEVLEFGYNVLVELSDLMFPATLPEEKYGNGSVVIYDSSGTPYVYGSEALQEAAETEFTVIQGAGNPDDNNNNDDDDESKKTGNHLLECWRAGELFVAGSVALGDCITDIIYDAYSNYINGEPSLYDDVLANLGEQAFTGFDSIQNADGTYNVTGYASFISEKWGDFRECVYTGVAAYGKPFAILSGNTYSLWYMDANGAYKVLYINAQWYQDGKAGNSFSINSIGTSECTTVITNIPVFDSVETALSAFEANDFTKALNYAKTYQEADWLAEDWVGKLIDPLTGLNALSNFSNIARHQGLNALGNELTPDDYVDYLRDYFANLGTDKLPEVDPAVAPIVFSGEMPAITIDPTRNPVIQPVSDPGTNPGTNPGTGSDPDIPIDQPATEVIELDTTLPSMPETFLPLAEQMKIKFPFSIPWDIKYLFDKLSSQGREPPRWVLPFVIESIGLKGELVIDLKNFEPVSKISRLFLTLLFCLGLINMTIKIVGMRKEE